MIFWAFTPAKGIIYKSIHLSDLAGLLAHCTDTVRNFRAFHTSFKFGILDTVGALCNIFVWFFCFIYSLVDLLNTGFTINKIGLFCGGEH